MVSLVIKKVLNLSAEKQKFHFFKRNIKNKDMISNLNQAHLTEEQIKKVVEALNVLEQELAPLYVNLTPEDRNKYGRVNEQNKLFINKVYDFATHQSDLRSPEVDWDEFFRDFATRNFCENIAVRLEKITTQMKNRKTLADYDNYQDALEDYAYTGYKAGSRSSGYEDKHKACKQFFTKNRKKETSEPAPPPAEEA